MSIALLVSHENYRGGADKGKFEEESAIHVVLDVVYFSPISTGKSAQGTARETMHTRVPSRAKRRWPDSAQAFEAMRVYNVEFLNLSACG